MNYLAFLRLTVNLFFLQTIKIFHRLKKLKIYLDRCKKKLRPSNKHEGVKIYYF